MKFSTLFLTAFSASGIHEGLCYPGMGKTVKSIENFARDKDPGFLSEELIGDLAKLPDNKLSRTGKEIKRIITGKTDAESNDRAFIRPALGGFLCRMDTCCVWQHVSAEMESMFRGDAGRCTNLARQAIRIGFHDAGTWSKSGGGGGADGSLILSDEMTRFENAGMEEMVAKHRELYEKYRNQLGYKSVTMADLIQVGAKVATVVCPLGPRIKTYVGRKDSSQGNPDGKLPSPFADAESLIAMFEDKTISPRGLIALLGAHTTSQQTAVNVSRAGDPQDSTPGVWDMLYYQETLGKVKAPERVFMFQSDLNLAKHPETKEVFEYFAQPGSHAQKDWNEDYAREYVRLSMLGVNNINDLKDCTKVLPRAITSFRNKDQRKLDKWLKSFDWSSVSKKIAKLLFGGDEITVPEETIPVKSPKSKY
ncbi:Versatile peroxidase [Paramyrothecium foliicola]|nr:Versatile peroxidase [Paramyrothecium foliicola]